MTDFTYFISTQAPPFSKNSDASQMLEKADFLTEGSNVLVGKVIGNPKSIIYSKRRSLFIGQMIRRSR